MIILPPWVKEEQKNLVSFLESLETPVEKIKDTDMLLCAFVHKSYASDFKEEYNHNERLEFVGDAVLGSVIAKALFLNFPTMQESNMTLYKIGLVREETLAKVAQNIKLNIHIFISKGEEKNHGRLKASIISDALEALIWYIFLDFWYEVAENFVLKYIYPEIKVLSKAPVKSYKTMAQEQVQKLYKVLPTYENIEEKTDEKWNVLLYSAKIMVEDKLLATWTGTNKKKAQEDAAKNYYEATNPDKNI